MPAGAATLTARASTNRVLSRTERTITLPICGFRYDGSSIVKDDGCPLRSVSERSFVTRSVSAIPITITSVSSSVSNTPEKTEPTKNIESSAIIVGKRPLHGTKLFVIIARSLSLGESMILQPVTPTALQPKPIHTKNAN